MPNLLTIFRVVLTLVFIFFLSQDGLVAKVLALVVLTLASLTDFFDGYYARKHHLVSRFGKIMDPIADKFLMLSAFFIFMRMHLIAAWMFVIILAREAVVTGLRLFAMRRGTALAAEGAGKVKTVLQIIAVYLIILFIILAQLSGEAPWLGVVMPGLFNGIYVFMLAVVLATLWSGLFFVWNNRHRIAGCPDNRGTG